MHFGATMVRGVPALQFAAVSAAAGVLASGCGSTAETSVTPNAPARCQATLAAPSTNFGPGGGTGSVAVTVARECSWSARSAVPWIAVTGGQDGQGEGTVTFRIGENADPTARRGSLSIAEQSVQLAQDAAPCRFTVESDESSAPATGGDISIGVRTHALCSWTTASAVDWMSASPSSGKGDATVHVTVAANPSAAPRSASVTVAGQTVTLSQQPSVATPPSPAPAPPAPAPAPNPPAPSPTPPAPTPPAPTPAPPPTCAFQLTPASLSIDSDGGTSTARISTTAACEWTATSSVNWVSLNAGSGTGTTDLRITVAENFATTARSTTLTIATKTFQVTQSAAEPIDVDGEVSGLSGSCPNLRFAVGNYSVTTSSATDFRKGNCSDVRNGRDVKVRGYKQPSGTLAAVRVELAK